jgi:hypothetical protein
MDEILKIRNRFPRRGYAQNSGWSVLQAPVC